MKALPLLRQLVEAGLNMRNIQKAYFASKNILERQQLLAASKKAEKHFDDVIKTYNLLIKNNAIQSETQKGDGADQANP